MLNNGTFISGQMTVGVADDLLNVNGVESVFLPPGDIILASRGGIDQGKGRLRALRGSSADTSSQQDSQHHRTLIPQYTGMKSFLAIRVTDSEGRAHSDNARTISDKIFGSYGDQINIKSQLSACSHGKVQVTNEYDTRTFPWDNKFEAPGVVEITIPISLRGNDRRAIRRELILATQVKLGLESLPGPFDNIMYVLEGCYTDCGWAAYAYVNGWLSIYQGDNYKFASVQMHGKNEFALY